MFVWGVISMGKTNNRKKTKIIRVLGFDPGPKNFGCFAGELILKRSMPLLRIKESAMLENTVQDLTGDLNEHIEDFLDEMMYYLETYNPHAIVTERFMTRGFKGATIEYVCVMIGALTTLAYSFNPKIKIITPTAASWKNRVNKQLDLKTLYKVLKRYGIPDHRVDASLMSMYVLKKYDNPYTFLSHKEHRNKYIRSLIDSESN